MLRSTPISIIELRSLNAIAPRRIPNEIHGMLHGHRPSFLCIRIYYGAWTAVPLCADRLLRCPSDLDGALLTARDHVAVKTAMPMEKRQARRALRLTRWVPAQRERQTASAADICYIVCLERVPIYYPLRADSPAHHRLGKNRHVYGQGCKAYCMSVCRLSVNDVLTKLWSHIKAVHI